VKVETREGWLAARVELLAREKELTQTLTRIWQSQDSSLPSPRTKAAYDYTKRPEVKTVRPVVEYMRAFRVALDAGA
jgi:predicted dithiol-disulfide oxidoreductase (DUF899 family)